jgi:hypothetical protein
VNERRIVAIIDEEWLSGSRYPEFVGTGSTKTAIERGRAADLSSPEVVGGIVDDRRADEVLSALDFGKPVVLSPESLAVLMRKASNPATTLLERDWIPLLPVGLSAEVLAAAEVLKSEALGVIRSCHLTTYVGPLATQEWEQDAPFARSFFEATVLGLDLLASLFGTYVNSTRWVTADVEANFGIAVHHLDAGVVAIQEIMPSRLAASPLFTATVDCEDGRVLLRNEFAPSGMTVWEAQPRSFRCPAFAREKPNVQAPDTVRGGVETTVLITALANGGRDGLPTREHALEILRHAIAFGIVAPKTQSETEEEI